MSQNPRTLVLQSNKTAIMKEVQVKNRKFSENRASRSIEENPATENVTYGENFSKSVHRSAVNPPSNKLRTFRDLLENGKDAQFPFFTEKAFMDMSLGKIPDFESLYYSLSEVRVYEETPLSALQFLPALREFRINDQEEIKNFIDNPETNHVLVQNDLIKIVLIRWNPGDECNIHGHAERGCVFKVLEGKIVEKRFSADDEQRQLAEGTYEKNNIAYIDDLMGLHCVGNPFSKPAITLHMYTPGNYKPKK